MSAVGTLRIALYGNPPVPGYKPSREGVLEAFTELSLLVADAALGGVASAVFPTLANANANLAYPAGTIALIYADTANDLAVKSGASGSGSWTLTTILRDSFESAAYSEMQPFVVASAANAADAAAALADTLVARDEVLDTAGALAVTEPVDEVPAHSVGDKGGIDIYQVYPDRIVHKQVDEIVNDLAFARAGLAGRKRRGKMLCGVSHALIYGQSNAVNSHGTTQTPGGSTAAGAIITSNVPNALTFNVGELTSAVTTPATQMASLVTLNNTGMLGGSREGWGAACALMIAQLLNTEDTVTATALGHKWLFSSMGLSATAIEQLAYGTINFDRVVRDLEYGADRAAELTGAMQVYQPRNLLMVEGESDYNSGGSGTSFEQYVQKSAKLASDISIFSKKESGRTDDVIQWVIQVASHISYASQPDPFIAKAQLEMETRGICMPIIPGYGALTRYGPSPVYGMDTDQIHYIAPGFIKLAATWGFMMKRFWYDDYIEPGCRIINHDVQGAWTTLEFSGYGDLVLDTTDLPTWANSGIQAVNGAGAAITVSNVEIVDAAHRVLAVKTASPAAALRFGWAGATTTGRTGTGGTNIRDSLRDIMKFTRPDGVLVPIDNHLPIMELTL